MNTRISANASNSGPLARIAALATGSKKKAEDDENAKKADDKKDDDKAEDKKDDDKAEDKKDEDKAEEKDDDKAEEKDEDEKDDDQAKAKDGDDDSDEDDKADKKARAIRLRERGRVRAIVTSKAAQRSAANCEMALNLALNTSMTRGEAISLLSGMSVQPEQPTPTQSQSQSQRETVRQRMDSTPSPQIGTETSSSDNKPNLAAQIITAGKKRRGEI